MKIIFVKANIWQTTLFTKDSNDKYCLSPIFKKICNFDQPQDSEDQQQPNLKSQLLNIIKLTEEYPIIRRSLSPATKNIIQERDEADEGKLFKSLKDYLTKIIDILTFISIVSKQKNLIHSAMSSMQSEDAKSRLSIDSFGIEKERISLYNALREFADALLIKDPNIYQLFDEECSIFFSFEDRQIIDVTSRLERNSETMSLLEEARETYLKYIKKPFKLSKIVDLFKKGKYVKGIIDVCLSKAKAIDPSSIGLNWYKGDRSSDDKEGRHYFDLRYNCYELIFDLIEEDDKIKFENIEQMLTSEDELFHICLYYKMLEQNHLDDLLSFKSHFIEPFLEEYAPDHMWIYSSRHGNYIKSANQLLDMIYDKKKDFPLQQRIDWLLYVKQLSNAGGDTELMDKADLDLKLSEIQKELNKQLSKIDGEDYEKEQPLQKYLFTGQDLFTKICESSQWDLALKILAFYPTSSDDLNSIISKTWSNYFEDQLRNEDQSTAMKRIETTCQFNIEMPHNDVCNPLITLMPFEEYRIERKFYELWAVDAMLRAKFDKNMMLAAYFEAFQNRDISQSVKLDFAYAVAYLVHLKAHRMNKNLDTVKKYLTENGADCRYYYEALKYLKEF